MGWFDSLFGPPRPARFARLVQGALRKAGDRRRSEFNAAEFQILFFDESGAAGVANLHNVYLEYCAAPRANRRRALSQIVRSMLSYAKEAPDEFDDARPDLRLIVRSRSYLEALRLQNRLERSDGPHIPYLEVGDHLLACLVYDLPESMRSIDQTTLDGWGVSFYEAFEAARRNLGEAPMTFARIGEGFYSSLTGDNYDASRVVLTDIVRQFAVRGAPIAMTPHRDQLLVAGEDDETSLALMAELASQALDGPRPISFIPLRLVGDDWETWRPPPDHPARTRFQQLELRSMFGEYAEQKKLLEALAEQTGDELFIASYSVVEKEGGELVSYCVWSEGVDTLLPRTDRVIFFRPEDEVVASATWDRVAELVGDLLEPDDSYPPRFRVRSFPSDAQLAQLGDEPL